MTAMGEVLRTEVEKHTGKIDPYRVTREEENKDPTAFSKRARAGPPYHPDVKMDEFIFWFLMILDTHPAIIEAYGRYLYRNRAIGRESTEREKVFLEDTDHFGEESSEVADKISEDIREGKWTPLGG
jgi:hypothetical protein